MQRKNYVSSIKYHANILFQKYNRKYSYMEHKRNMYSAYCSSNVNLGQQNWFDFGATQKNTTKIMHEKTQDIKPYSGDAYNIGMRNVFGKDDFSEEPVGQIFFGEQNIKRLQKMIRAEIYEQSKHNVILEEDQDTSDLLIAMRSVYQMHGMFQKINIIRQVKELNKKLIDFIIPDMMTEIKQYYGYMKDVNEPLKPIDRPVNLSSAGRRTLPSISTIWTQ